MKDNTAAVHVQVPVEVTSFLLNEKRTEITKIELKQRITVLLVPNKHLETPNYRLERLRHDDPRLENLQASYSMIEEPDDEVGITRREKAKAKQEPVIKGILPETPAPVVAPKAEPAPAPAAPVVVETAPARGFFGWIKSLLGGASEAPPAPALAQPATAPAATPEGGAKRDSGRGGRGRSDRSSRSGRGSDGRDGERAETSSRSERGSRGGRRSERGERDEARPDAVASPPADDNRSESRRTRGARPEREPRRVNGEAAADSAAVAPELVAVEGASGGAGFADTVPGAEVAAEGENRGERSRRRRRRGGRDRGEEARDSVAPVEPGVPDEQAPAAETLAPDVDGVVAQDQPATAEPVGEAAGEQRESRRRGSRGGNRQRREPTDNEGAVVGAGDEPVATEAEATGRVEAPAQPLPASAVVDTAVAETAVAEAALAPVAAELPGAPVDAAVPATPPSVARFELDAEQLRAVAAAAGLEWVSSDADKIRAVQEALAREPRPVHVPREPRPVVVVDEGPLVLVETRKDLSQYKLPFEAASAPH